jgi:glutathione S-transferase
MDIDLLHFPYSHVNEKARWALDFKGVAHRRRPLLPGLHMAEVKRLSGQTSTPVLRIDGRVVHGSTGIMEELELIASDPPLFPGDESARQELDAIVRRFDDDWAPRIRRAVLAVLLEETGYLARMFSTGQPILKRLLYRAMLPSTKNLIRKANGITGPGSIRNGHAACREALRFVAENTGPEGYLVGARFSAADLTAAAILSPLADPPDCDMTRPRPLPDSVAQFQGQYADHPGAAWVLEMYRRHRTPHEPKV